MSNGANIPFFSESQNSGLQDLYARYANESFKHEKKLYDMAGYRVSSPEELYTLLTNPIGFEQFENKLKKFLYGEDYDWVQFLYKPSVRNRIVRTSTQNFHKLFNTAYSKSRFFRNEQILYQEKNRAVGKKNRLSPDKIESQIRNLAAALVADFDKNWKANHPQTKAEEALFGELVKDLERNFTDKLLTGSPFTFRVRTSGNKKTGWNTHSKKTLTPLFIKEFYDDDGDQWEFEFSDPGAKNWIIEEIYMDQKWLEEQLLQLVQDEFNKSKYNGLNLSLSKNKSGFMLKLEEAEANLQEGDDYYYAVSQAYLTVLADAIYEASVEARKYDTIDKSKVLRYIPDFANLLRTQAPEVIQQIKQTDTSALVSGDIGEKMAGLFLQLLAQERNYTVLMLGQSKTFGGVDEAVDIYMAQKGKGKIQGFGFQVKNYPSLRGNVIEMYKTKTHVFENTKKVESNDPTGQSEYMARYFTEKVLGRLKELLYQLWDDRFYHYPYTPDLPSPKKVGGVRVDVPESASFFGGNLRAWDQIKPILYEAIPNFIRYGAADTRFADYNNNFFLINFSFIPSSCIFIALSNALAQVVKQHKYTEQVYSLFGFAYGNDKDGDSQKLFNASTLKTWDNAFLKMIGGSEVSRYEAIAQKNLLSPYQYMSGNDIITNHGEIPDLWRENLKLIFGGLEIHFTTNLEIIFKKAYEQNKG